LKERIIAISLLFILIAPVATIYLYIQIEKSAIRREIKGKMIASINEEELVLLKFTKEETKIKLRWEHSKEFEYNGQMYDIVSSETKGDSIFYRCWWDYEETELNKKLKKMVAIAFNQDDENRKTQEIFYSYLFLYFCNNPFNWQATPSLNIEVVYQDTLNLGVFNALRISPPTPPPKIS
jgi:hypothetical protein